MPKEKLSEQVQTISTTKETNNFPKISSIQTVIHEDVTILLNPLCNTKGYDKMYSTVAYQKAAKKLISENPEIIEKWLHNEEQQNETELSFHTNNNHKYSDAFKHLLGKNPNRVYEFLQSPHEEVRLGALYWIILDTELPEAEKEFIFKTRAHDVCDGIRALAHRGLISIEQKNEETKQILSKQINSINDQTVEEAVNDKNKWAPSEDDPFMENTDLQKENPYLGGIEALTANNPSMMIDHINSPDTKVRLTVAYWLEKFAQIEEQEKERLLQHLARDTDRGIQTAACHALKQIRHPNRETQNILREERLQDTMGDGVIDSAAYAEKDNMMKFVVKEGKRIRLMNRVANTMKKILPDIEVDLTEPIGARALIGDDLIHGRTAHTLLASIFPTIADSHPQEALTLNTNTNPKARIAYCIWLAETSTISEEEKGDLLLPLTADKNFQVRTHARYALANLPQKSPKVWELLKEHYNDGLLFRTTIRTLAKEDSPIILTPSNNVFDHNIMAMELKRFTKTKSIDRQGFTAVVKLLLETIALLYQKFKQKISQK